MQTCKINNAPIGVFDSGLGGLTVVKQLIKQLPNERVVYYGDTARLPYGTKSKQSIIRFSLENADVLMRHHVKAIVVACNSSSSYAIPSLKLKLNVPILDVISPSAKKAVISTKNKRIGVIATSATISSKSYKKAIKKIDNKVKIITQACPLFVPIIEEGWADTKISLEIAKKYLSDLKKQKIDSLILGCTHYPLMKNVIKKILGPNVLLIDSSVEVAKNIKDVLIRNNIQNSLRKTVKHKFIISDKPQEFQKIARRFLGMKLDNVTLG